MEPQSCAFCEIIARTRSANIRYEDEQLIVFDNHLDWIPLMLLLAPKKHMTQSELWTSSTLISKACALAVRMGELYAPGGFRVLSNFGEDALQTVDHAHMHILGGTFLGRYVKRSTDT